jgi:hypothetical protein
MALISDVVEPATKNSSKSSLAVLTRAADAIAKYKIESRVVIILDEFDEIHQEMYRHGPTAETFFSNLRSLAAKQNVSFMLVGGENMPFIMAAQGDQLNKFVREPVDYFSRDSEWDDFRSLVTNNGTIPISWHDSALNEIYVLTNGHPYYTKLLCSSIFHNAIESRDADVTADEVRIAESHLIGRLDTNAFAHFWKDGISAGRDEAEVIALKRCRLFVAIARAMRMGHKLTVGTIAEEGVRAGLRASDIPPLLNDLCRREILAEKGGQYDVTIRIFENWLVSYGLNKLVADTLGDELEASIASEEEAAFVTAPEVTTLIERWPLYKGRRISGEDVRAWLDQVASHRERRLLYKVLSLLRIVSEEEVREKLRSAHSFVKSLTTPFTPANRSQRRFDLIVTYVDGPGKSGSSYASKYAEENLISATCVAEMGTFADTVIEVEKRVIANGIVIVDDIAVTGESLSANLTRFIESHRVFAEERSLPIIVIVLFATKEADQMIRGTMDKLNYPNIDLRVGEYLSNKNEIFYRNNWESEDEYYRAKRLCSDIGLSIYSKNPFGFGGKALNMVFYDTCPNNTLPLVHSSGKEWRPLFPRIAN